MKHKNNQTERILLGHGSGGKLMHRLINDVFKKRFSNPVLNELSDSAVIRTIDTRRYDLTFTTDSYVVKPLFFPGADIGKLAVCGTVNDLAVCGSRPLFISCGAIIEEGLEVKTVERIADSMATTAKKAGVRIVTGDVKVVARGEADTLFINTSGIGIRNKKIGLSTRFIEPGDTIIVNGGLAEHGLAVLAARAEFNFKTTIKSDCAPLNSLIEKLLDASNNIKFMRDPTRGGLAATLNEIVQDAHFGIQLDEPSLPISSQVAAACELLGFDPLYVANEGKVVVIVKAGDAKKVLSAMKRHPGGERSAIIGEVTREYNGKVILKTKIGGSRIIDMPVAEQLPRIC